MKTSRVQELEKAVAEHQRELEHREEQSKDYEEKLKRLQEQASVESGRGEKLDEALQECEQQIVAHIEQLDEMKKQHKDEMKSKKDEVNTG